jgi:protein TonB
MRRIRVLGLSVATMAAVFLGGCSGQPAPIADNASTSAPAASLPATTPLDDAALREAATSALASQRIYAPAGANAIEHYLALRTRRPDDRALSAALLELLPYAVIGSEQAIERGDLAEARRLVALVEQVDPEFPALARLGDRILATELREARRLALEAEAEAAAEAQRQEQALLDARPAPEAGAANASVDAGPVAPAAIPATGIAPAEPPPVAAAPAAALPTPAPAATVPETATAATGAPVGAPAAPTVPRLLSAPSPRYPALALRRQLEGEVTVQFTIQPDGRVSEPRVVGSNPPGVFDEAALVATRRWQFEATDRSVQSTRVVQFRLGTAGS